MFCVNKEAKLSSGKKRSCEHQERAGVSEVSLRERWEAGEEAGSYRARELLIPQELKEPPEHSRGLDRTSPPLWVSEQWCGKQMGGTY